MGHSKRVFFAARRIRINTHEVLDTSTNHNERLNTNFAMSNHSSCQNYDLPPSRRALSFIVANRPKLFVCDPRSKSIMRWCKE